MLICIYCKPFHIYKEKVIEMILKNDLIVLNVFRTFLE